MSDDIKTDPEGKTNAVQGVRINNLVMRVVAVDSMTVRVEVAEVFSETMTVGGDRQRSVRIGEWRDPTDAERDAFEALAWT